MLSWGCRLVRCFVYFAILAIVSIWIGVEIEYRRDYVAWIFIVVIPFVLIVCYVKICKSKPKKEEVK